MPASLVLGVGDWEMEQGRERFSGFYEAARVLSGRSTRRSSLAHVTRWRPRVGRHGLLILRPGPRLSRLGHVLPVIPEEAEPNHTITFEAAWTWCVSHRGHGEQRRARTRPTSGEALPALPTATVGPCCVTGRGREGLVGSMIQVATT